MRDNPADYLTKARQNEAFAEFLMNGHSQFEEWAFTALFYSAIHYVNAFLAHSNLSLPTIHPQRLKLINMHLRSVYKPFRLLKDMSEHTRYKTRVLSKTPQQHGQPAFLELKTEVLRHLPSG
jgi:hypothetical protein